MPRVILASKSPRRKELLELLKIPFEIIVSDIDEHIDYDNDLVKEIEKLSYQKAQAVYKDHNDALVIGSDTIVKIGNDILGKPKSYDEAEKMLRELSDNTHEVVTAVTIFYQDQTETFSSVAKVTFYPLSDEEIKEYIATNEPMDKAGAYAIQGDAAKFIRSIEGDFYTIVGLPIAELYHRLQKYF
ncbi:MAG: septum formation protein Maf [Erysipelotrichaceae bacterium]|nr:septum formation protein Maf [Erysipelotrichaceae bacterium]